MNKFVKSIRSLLLGISVLTGGCVTTSTLAATSDNFRSNDVKRIIAVGDIHGAHLAFVDLLRATSLIDANQNWSGGNTHLVSLGDILDRGADSRKSMDLLIKLQSEAKKAGGQVHVVIGNHELMNVMGDLRYVSPGEYSAFAADETPDMRASAFQRLEGALGLSKSDFDSAYPHGYFAHRAAFSPEGKYGKWLLSLPAITVLNDTAFVHGGLPDSVAKDGLKKTNRAYMSAFRELMEARQRLINENLLPNDEQQDFRSVAKGLLKTKGLKSAQKRKVQNFVALDESDILNADGPVWYRGAMMCRSIFEDSILNSALSKLDVDRVVVGHTPSRDGLVHTRYNGKLIQLDTGMLVSHYKGRPSALVIKGNDIKVQYLKPKQTTSLASELTSPATQSNTEIENALNNGIVDILTLGSGDKPAKVQISHLGKKYDGLFYPGNKDHAAYVLDQLLGFDLVPPTVKRTVASQTGSLQLSFKNAFTDTARRADNISVGGWCALDRQYQLMLAFDMLTANERRTGDNILYRKNHGLIYLTDFSGGFSDNDRLPSGIRRDAVELPTGVRQAMANINQKRLSDALGHVISASEIEAILSRRDEMLRKFK